MAKLLLSNIIHSIFFMQMFQVITFAEPYFKCSLKDKACLTTQAGGLLQTFVQGIPELGIENLDKMSLGFIKINQDGFTQIMSDLDMEGLKNATVEEVSFNMALKLMKLTFTTTMVWTSEAKYDGYFLMQPIYGDGKMTLTIKNVETEMIFIYNITENDNQKHFMDFLGYRYAFYIKGGVDYDLQNIYNGDKEKSDVLHAFLQDNWKIVISMFAKDITDKIHDNIFNAIKTYLRSQPLEDIALYP